MNYDMYYGTLQLGTKCQKLNTTLPSFSSIHQNHSTSSFKSSQIAKLFINVFLKMSEAMLVTSISFC